MRMSLLRSPEAYGDKDMSTYGDRGTHCVPTPLTPLPRGQRSLTKYLPSEEMAMQRTWVLWPGGCPSAPFLARGIT